MRFQAQGKKICYLLIVLVVFGVLFSGCSKQRAKLKLNKAEKLIAEAQKNNAEQNTKEDYEAATKALSDANSAYGSQDFAGALEKAKTAVDLSKKTLDQARERHANFLQGKAKESIDIANKNQGTKENPDLYKKVIDTNSAGDEKRKKAKYEAAVNLYSQVVSDVETLLSRLQNEAIRKQDEVKRKLGEMQKIGVRDYSPNDYVEVSEMLDEIDTLIKQQRDYITAFNRSEEAIRKAEEGIERTKQKQCQERIRLIETKLVMSVQKGAALYQPELLKKSNENFDSVLVDFRDKRYDKILQIADSMTSQVVELLFLTKKASANARIQSVDQDIRKLESGGVETYLPGRIAKAIAKSDEAKQIFAQNTEESFDKVEEEICELAKEEIEKIAFDFNNLAGEKITEANEALIVTSSVFGKMAHIFIPKAPNSFMDELDKQFENNKQALMVELDTLLKNAEAAINTATTTRQQGFFKDAIEIAENQVKKVAENVLAQTYHVVAHNAMMELAEQISHYENEGAREYVPVEIDRTKNLLEQTKELIRTEQFKPAVSKASETRAQLELTIQELIKRAVSDIEKAKKSITDSKDYQVNKYKPEDLTRSENLVKDAQKYLENRGIKNSIKNAEETSVIISNAITAASGMWAEEAIKTAEASIQKAEEAGANGYAGPTLDDAKKQLVKSKELNKQGTSDPASYVKAKDTAEQAAVIADKALYYKINNAESSINTAKNVGGWKYNDAQLSKAIQIAKDSRTAMENKQYLESIKLSDQAKSMADGVIEYSIRANFNERASLIRKTINTGAEIGISQFQTSETNDIKTTLDKLEKEYAVEKFESISNELNKLEAKLASITEKTPEIFSKMHDKETMRLQKLITENDAKIFAPQAVEDATTYLRFSDIDFNKKNYTSSYENIQKAIKTIDGILLRHNEEIYAQDMAKLFNRMQANIKKLYPLLDMSPELVYEIAKDSREKNTIKSVAVAAMQSPYEFRKEMEEIYNEAAELVPPKTKEAFHRDALVAINNARLGGVYFEKLIILDEFKKESVKTLIKKAYKYIELAQGEQGRLQKTLALQAEQSRTIRVENLPGWSKNN